MVMDNDSWDLLLGLDFLIKIGVVVDIEWQFIQICHGPRANVKILPLNMVNMLQSMNNHVITYFQEMQIQNQLKFENT
jgi:hypothetical protein